MRNILTIDVEEYFHPTEVQVSGGPRRWEELPSRVEDACRRTLELLDRHEVSATFFVLGWVARRHGRLLREIAAAGHEIASHGYRHRLVYEMSPAEFRRDTEDASCMIEDACGMRPRAYRAASYSITAEAWWAMEILAECGYTHDSSIYPIAHDRYGIPGYPRHAHVVTTPSGPILEVPIATALLSNGGVAPVGGGAYLRLLPYFYTAAGIRRINRIEGEPACVYFHPWELDASQPRLARGILSRFRTYAGIRGMPGKLDRLLSDFEFAGLSAVHSAAGLNAAQETAAVGRAVAAGGDP